MTRAEYIKEVKVKLDEFSPFEEPSSFIAAGGDPSYDKVKPVVAYIDSELDKATQFCLRMLPSRLLSSDITKVQSAMTIVDGVGIISFDGDSRLCRIKVEGLGRDITHFFTTEDAEYLIQQNKYTRSGTAKPSAFYNPEEKTIEVYSFLPNTTANMADVWSIKTTTKAEDVTSNISDYIVLKCAQQVLNILGNTNGATAMENEFTRKLNVE